MDAPIPVGIEVEHGQSFIALYPYSAAVSISSSNLTEFISGIQYIHGLCSLVVFSIFMSFIH